MPSPDDLNRLGEVSLFGSADPLLGSVLGGRWEVLQFIGEGSMSSAYKARDVQTGTRVVLKMLHPHLLGTSKNMKRFEQRAKTFMMLIHERIARIYDLQQTNDGGMFLVVEGLNGESLENLLAKSGHLPADEAIDVFLQVCEGLEFAHGQDVLHRDLKPSNIMMVDTGGLNSEVKLVDFGIAKLLSDETDDVKNTGYITRTREVFGSPMYMSPEQCMGKRLDGRSDIYSIACVMYETLTGKPPFVGKNVLETAYKHMNESPKSFAADRPADRALGRFESVIFKCLQKDPNERYQSVSQLKADLLALPIANDMDWVTDAYALKKNSKSKKEKKEREPSKRRFISFEVAIFVGASLLLAIVVGVWAFSFLGAENQSFPEFNNDQLWVVKEKRQPPPAPNFATQEESAKIELSTIENEKGPDSREYAVSLYNLAKLYLGAGHWADAVNSYRKLIEITKKTGAPTGLPVEYSNLCFSYFMQGQLTDAETAAIAAKDEAERAGLSSQPVVMTPLKVLGDVYSQKNQLEKALNEYDQLYNIVEPKKFQNAAEFEYAAAWSADIFRRQGKYEDAEHRYRLALEMARNSGAPAKNLFNAKVLYGLGLVLEKENNYKEAETLFREAMPIVRDISGPRSAMAGAVRAHLIEALWKTNPMAAIMARVKDPTQDGNSNGNNPNGSGPYVDPGPPG